MERAWWVTAAVGVTAGLAAALVGEAAQSAVRALSATLLIVVTVRQLRRRPGIVAEPWTLLAIGGGLALVSGAVRLIHGAAIGEVAPFPSYAEIPGYIGYAFIIAAARSFWHHRSSRPRDAAGTLDGFLVASAAAVIVFTTVLSEYLRDDSVAWAARLGNLGYILLTLTLLGTVARLAIGPGVRNTSWRLIATATLSIITNDLLLLLGTTGSSWALAIAGITSPLAFFAATSAILHPEAEDLTRVPGYVTPQLTLGRLAMLASALLTLPAALLWAFVRGTDADLPVLVLGSAVLSMLSLGRILLLFRANEKATGLEVALAESGRHLLNTASPTSFAMAVADTVQLVLGDGAFATTSDGGSNNQHLIWRSERGHPIEFENRVIRDLGELYRHLGVVPHDQRVVHLDLGDRAQFGRIVLDNPSVDSPQSLALQTMAAQITQALASLSLTEARYRQRAEQRLSALIEQSSDLVTVLDDSFKMQFVSPNATRVLGVAPATLIGNIALSLIHPDDLAGFVSNANAPSQTNDQQRTLEVRLRTAVGEYRWFDVTARDFRSDPGVGGIVITARDVHDERAAKIGLERSEQWFRGLVQHSSDVIAVLDETGVFTYASPAAEELFGYRPDQLRGHSFPELLRTEDAEGLNSVRQAIRAQPTGARNLELTIERADRSLRTAEITITDLRDDPSVSGLVLNIRDVTDRKKLEDDLRHQALHDDLTGLGSRVQFHHQLTRTLGPDRRQGSMVAALFIDIDDFKTINDSLGHAAGDQVLVEISSRLQTRLRLHDRAARFGGDEFAVVLSDVYGEGDITGIADRILEELSLPVTLHGQAVRIGVSIGIAIDEDGTASPDDLIRAADLAMYEAKEQGKGRWAMFESSMADQTLERFELGNSLGDAIENDELMVYYQPIVDLGSGKTLGVEALVRWNHPMRGMVSPDQFIPIAEKNGLIDPLGCWVLDRAVHQVAAWRADGHDIYASVNISAVQLQREGIVTEVLEIVDAAGMDRHAVVLELTESVLIDDFDLANQRIEALREAGLRVAIDDFGTGYASLTYVDQFAADILKIDQSFVSKLENNDESAIVSTVLSIAEAMGAQTVAEGIEVPDQHRRLLALGCSFGQGYYFTRPAPAQAITETLMRELEGEALTGHAH